MKNFIASFLLIFVSATTHAGADMDRQSYCFNYASMLKSIAAWRDQGMAPEKTLEMIRGVKGISFQGKKDAINAIYFDKSYADARGTEFGNQARSHCLTQKEK